MKLKFFSMMLALGLLLAAAPAFALTLHEARAQGVVGEKLDGYVAAIKKSSEAAALVDEVNEKRRAEYARISKENDQPVDVVAKLAAEQIINKLEPGEFYQGADGSWKTR